MRAVEKGVIAMALNYRTGLGAMNLDSVGHVNRYMQRKTATAAARTFKKAFGGGKIVY